MVAEPGNVARLREAIKGTVILPGDAAYDDARATFNAMIDRRPRLIVRCASALDVVRAVTFAADEGLPVSVRGGGHAVAGQTASGTRSRRRPCRSQAGGGRSGETARRGRGRGHLGRVRPNPDNLFRFNQNIPPAP
jgi:hypothetical protein